MAGEIHFYMSSSDALLVGIDIGTTNLKAVAIRVSGHVEFVARRPMVVEKSISGAAEFNLDALDRDIISVLKELAEGLAAKNIACSEIACIGVASVGESFVGLDNHDQRVTPCPTWFDRRTSNLRERWGLSPKAWFDITGMVDDDIYTGYRLSWWRSHHPEIFSRVQSWLMMADYAVFRLCGQKAIHPSLAARSGLADRSNGKWSQELLSAVGISSNSFSEILPACTVAGRLTNDIAKMTGIPQGLPVVCAGHDHACAGLGCGLAAPGSIINSVGTAESIITVVPSPLTFEQVGEGAYDCYPHAIGHKFLLSGHTPSSGAFLDWLIGLLGGPQMDQAVAANFWRAAEAELPGCGGVRVAPFLAGTGSPWNRRDLRADLSFIGHGATGGTLLRAAVESLAAWLTLNLNHFENITQMKVPALILTGGGTRNNLANAVKAALINRPLVIPNLDEAAGAGAGLVAGIAVGAVENSSALNPFPAVELRTILPDKNLVEQYQQLKDSLLAHVTPQSAVATAKPL